jgi:hypothetical protein
VSLANARQPRSSAAFSATKFKPHKSTRNPVR